MCARYWGCNLNSLPRKGFICYVALLVCLCATEALANEGHEYRWGDFAYRVVNFIIFFGILWYFTGKLIKNYFRGRRQNIQDTFDNLDSRREAAKKKLSEVEAHIANLEQERRAILDESRSQAEALKKNIIEDAKRQAEQIVAQARLTAENEGRSILSQVRSTMADEIVDAAEKLLREKLGPAEHEKLITNSLNKVVLH
ncbi:MAG: ATP synthase F0 subunit B [Desulfovibrio sp.]|nr:ATP synthase F0 subunit B [Desulfovibrio sp.]